MGGVASGIRGYAAVPERLQQIAQTPRLSGGLVRAGVAAQRFRCGRSTLLTSAAIFHVVGPASAIWFAAPIATANDGPPFGERRPPFEGGNGSAAPKASGASGAGWNIPRFDRTRRQRDCRDRTQAPPRPRGTLHPAPRSAPSFAIRRPTLAVDPSRNSRSRNSGAMPGPGRRADEPAGRNRFSNSWAKPAFVSAAVRRKRFSGTGPCRRISVKMPLVALTGPPDPRHQTGRFT